MSTATVGTAPLLRTSLRHDGRMLAPWVVLATALSASSVLVYPFIFPDPQDRAGLALTVGANPALGLIFGPAFDLSTTDGFNAWRSLALGGFLVGLGMIFTVTRATRAQEDSGQAELLASGVMGRATRLTTGIAMGLLGSLLAGVVAGLVTVLCGGAWNASLLLGATFTATGWMFTGIAAITAQLGADARSANSIAVAVLAVMFLARGFLYSVDAPNWSLWIDPLGWMTETKPAVDDNWWPLLPAVALTVALLAVAFVLQGRRDFGVGAIAPRPGPARGSDRSALRLALRINRGSMITWIIAFLALGFVFGYFTTSVNDILGRNSAVQRVLAAGATSNRSLVSAFLVTILSLIGIIASIPGVQTMVKVRSEELDDRVEPVLAADVSRVRYYGANALVALAGPTLYVLIAGTLIATLATSTDIGVHFGDVLLQAVATAPAVWTVIGFSVLVIGARPQITIAAWLGVLASFVLTILGPTFHLWDWVLAISPFWHIPRVSDNNPDWLGLVWISLVTLLFLAIGFAGFRHRDLAR